MHNHSTVTKRRQNAPVRVRLGPSCLALLGWLGLKLPFGLGAEWTRLGATDRLGWRAEVWGATRDGQSIFRILIGESRPTQLHFAGTFEEAWAHARAVAEGKLVVRDFGRASPGKPVPAIRRRSTATGLSAQAA